MRSLSSAMLMTSTAAALSLPAALPAAMRATRVSPVVNGAVAGEARPVTEVWGPAGSVAFIVRRPG